MNKKFINILLILSIVIGLSAYRRNEDGWQEYKGRHFIIYYKEAPKDFVKTVEDAAEEYYQSIARELGYYKYRDWTWDDRAKIYIYDDQEDYQKNSKQYKWSSGAASAAKKIIRTFPAAHGFFDSTLPHEMGHIILREFIGLRARVPLWFEEGVAMYQEKAKRWGSHKKVLDAIENGTFLTINELNALGLKGSTDQKTVNLFYAEAASIVSFLIEKFGKHRFASLCRKLKDGKQLDWAIKEVYIRYRDYDQLNKGWVDYIKSKK